jgi:acetyl-CoA decarbonylase/synthase complex subunit gamma
LGAVGVAAHKIKEQTGFRVIFGPVHAKDIAEFINSGYIATPEMRKITFPFYERAKLIPVDLMYGKYKLLGVLFVFFILSGLDSSGFLFTKMVETCTFPLVNILGAYLAGILVAPLLLPVIPFRAFSLKGAFWSLVVFGFINMFFEVSLAERIAMGFISLSVASFVTMNFTGSSTYTSLSGVKKEMKWAIPFQIVFVAMGLIIFIISKLIV